MYRLTFIVSVVILGSLASARYHNVNCNSCGEECQQACGTRQFKTCCYNYMRKKRAPETFVVLSPITSMTRPQLPFFVDNADIVEAVDQHKNYPNEDSFDMRLNNNV